MLTHKYVSVQNKDFFKKKLSHGFEKLKLLISSQGSLHPEKAVEKSKIMNLCTIFVNKIQSLMKQSTPAYVL